MLATVSRQCPETPQARYGFILFAPRIVKENLRLRYDLKANELERILSLDVEPELLEVFSTHVLGTPDSELEVSYLVDV